MLNRASLLKDKLNFLKEHDTTNKEIEQLEKSLKYSKRGKSAKAKGANYERKIAKVFENSFPQLKFGRTPASGGYKKEIENKSLRGDIVCLNDDVDFLLHLELKNRKNGWKVVQDWFKQANEDCIKGKIPCVIMHQNLEKGLYNAEDFIMLRLSDFLNIVSYEKIVTKM